MSTEYVEVRPDDYGSLKGPLRGPRTDSGTDWTIKRTDGSTTHAIKTLTVLAGASPITGVS